MSKRMEGSLTAILVGAFGLLVLAWGNATVVAVPVSQSLAQAKMGIGINRPSLRAGSKGAAVSELQAALKLLGYYTGVVDGVYSESTAIAVARFQQASGLNSDGVVGQGTWDRLFPLTPSTASSPSTSTNSAAAFPVPSTAKKTPATTPNRSTPTSNTSVTNSKPTPASSSRSSKGAVATSTNVPVLQRGTRGSAVTRLQRRLRAVGLFKGATDGVFGPSTEAAVKAAQRRYRLNPDGVVGPATWRALLR